MYINLFISVFMIQRSNHSTVILYYIIILHSFTQSLTAWHYGPHRTLASLTVVACSLFVEASTAVFF
jgi:hypothetical protein